MIKFKRFNQGILGSNTYIIWDDESMEAAAIDAGQSEPIIFSTIENEALKLKYIILTHAHFDHIHFMPQYKKAFPEAKVVIHELDNEILPNPRLNASVLFGSEYKYEKADITVKGGEILHLGNECIEVISTPGHTPGGICLLSGKYLFSGDTLFYSGFGRTDLGAGDVKDMASSIERLYAMDGDIEVYPGHGTKTTIGRERADNPFMDF